MEVSGQLQTQLLCAALANSSLGLALSIDFSMLRRKPTRLELKLDDIEEFESIRKDLETLKAEEKVACASPCCYRNAEVPVVGHEDEHEEVADDHLDDMQHCLQE
ncbi:hypothetical protein MC885_002129, partial [Smutsia gigantea]